MWEIKENRSCAGKVITAWENAEQARDTSFEGYGPDARALVREKRDLAAILDGPPTAMSMCLNLLVTAAAILTIYVGELKSRQQFHALLPLCAVVRNLSNVPFIGPIFSVESISASYDMIHTLAAEETLRIAISALADYEIGNHDLEAARNQVLEKGACALVKWG